jgi:hypothetical protein
MSSTTNEIDIKDPLIKRNFEIIFKYLMRLVDYGLNYLKKEYLNNYTNLTIQKLSAASFFEFIVRDNIRNKIRNQIRVLIRTAVGCVDNFDGENIEFDFLEKLVERKYPIYEKNDMSLLHSLSSHPAYQEMKTISILTFRVSIVQITRLLVCKDSTVTTYPELVFASYNTYEQCVRSVKAVLSMIDQMMDTFENNLDMINIPIYLPTFTLRDFQYVRKVYEYGLSLLDKEIKKIYKVTE